MSKAVT